jgi:hypothetical protein
MQKTSSTLPQLREFAYTMAAALVVIFCLFLPWLFTRAIPYWPAVTAAILLLQAILFPKSLAPIQLIWMRIGAVLGWINTRIILAIVFFLLITPMGWLQRKRGKLHYKIGYDTTANTYKIPRQSHLNAHDLENPF